MNKFFVSLRFQNCLKEMLQKNLFQQYLLFLNPACEIGEFLTVIFLCLTLQKKVFLTFVFLQEELISVGLF